MALTLPRWALLAALACGAIWIGVLHSAAKPRMRNAEADDRILGPWAEIPTAERVALKQLVAVTDRLRLLDLRDSVDAVVAKQSTKPITVILDETLPLATRNALDSAITARWNALNVQAKTPVIVAVITDNATTVRGLPRDALFGRVPIHAFLPSAATGGRCVSLAYLDMTVSTDKKRLYNIFSRNLLSTETVGTLLNPCALIAAFGSPGPRVAEWLRDGRWTSARFADWGAVPKPWKGVVYTSRFGRTPAQIRSLEAFSDQAWAIRRYVSEPGIACLAAEPGACARVALDVGSGARDSAWRSDVVDESGTNDLQFYLPSRPQPLGPADGWLVSEMVRTLGPDRFATFWRSDLPVDAAFQAAAGESLDAWVHDWGVRMYGAAGVGPSLALNGVGAGMVILIAGLVVAIMVERRRRVA